jgi:hypothetical protein
LAEAPPTATESIPSQSGTHNISPGDPLPDTLSGFLSGSPFAYTVAIAPPYFSNGEHIGPAAISRNDTATPTHRTPGRSRRASRSTTDCAGSFTLPSPNAPTAPPASHQSNGTQQFVINPQPGYQTDWKGFGSARAGGVASYKQVISPCWRRDHYYPAQYLAG